MTVRLAVLSAGIVSFSQTKLKREVLVPSPSHPEPPRSIPPTQPGWEASLRWSLGPLPACRPQRRIPPPPPAQRLNHRLPTRRDTHHAAQLLPEGGRRGQQPSRKCPLSLGLEVCDLSGEGTVPPERDTPAPCSFHGLCLCVMVVLTMPRGRVVSTWNRVHEHC